MIEIKRLRMLAKNEIVITMHARDRMIWDDNYKEKRRQEV